MLKQTRLASSTCPGCGKHLDGATAPGDEAPSPGSISVCVYCLSVAIFDDDLLLRAPLPGELEALPPAARANLDACRKTVLVMQQHREVERRLKGMNSPEDAARYAPAVARGDAAVIGPRVSHGPPPRSLRPAAKVNCSECGRPIWVSVRAPRGRRACVECAAEIMNNLTRGA